mmetsp:Transcript_4890/g.7363  ORF Transcript_4890/g.7363 Transcript_4890/m.7363 type:complete len:99 (+) Transcript_4890:267-563(+)
MRIAFECMNDLRTLFSRNYSSVVHLSSSQSIFCSHAGGFTLARLVLPLKAEDCKVVQFICYSQGLKTLNTLSFKTRRKYSSKLFLCPFRMNCGFNVVC